MNIKKALQIMAYLIALGSTGALVAISRLEDWRPWLLYIILLLVLMILFYDYALAPMLGDKPIILKVLRLTAKRQRKTAPNSAKVESGQAQTN